VCILSYQGFYVCLCTHERRAVLITKNSSWKRKYDLIVIKLTTQYVCYNLCEKHKKYFSSFFLIRYIL